jgi:hypothetical protein
MPPRKSVAFKDYGHFDVQDSIARGLPVIPANHDNANSSHDSRRIMRKKKKDAERRSAEILSHHPRQISQTHMGYLPPATSDPWLRQNVDLSHLVDRPPPPSKPGKKVQRGAMIRKHRVIVPESLSGHQNYYHYPTPLHVVSCSPKGRIRLVKRPPNVEEYRKVMQT